MTQNTSLKSYNICFKKAHALQLWDYVNKITLIKYIYKMVKIKTIDAVNAYEALKSLKLSTIDDDMMINIWRNIKMLRKISEEYKKDVEDSRNAINDDEFNNMQHRLHLARIREEKVKNGEYTLTNEDRNDVNEINEYFAKYSAKVEKFNKEIDEKEVTLDIIKITDNDFLKVLKANDKDFSYMEQFEWMIC